MSQSATERGARLENNELQPVMLAPVRRVRAEGAGISHNLVCIGIFNWNRLLNELNKKKAFSLADVRWGLSCRDGIVQARAFNCRSR